MNENWITLINKSRETGNKYNYTDSLNINNYEGWFRTVQCLWGLNIWWLQNWQFATLLAQVFVMRHRMTCFRFLCFSSGLTCGLLKNHRTHQQLCCLTPIATLQYHLTSVITMVVSQEYMRRSWVPTMRSRDILFKAKGIILTMSTQIRWFLRWSGGGGWTGIALAQRRPRVSKLWFKGLSDYYSSEIAVEAARQETSGPKKKGYSHEISTQERAGQQL